MVAFGEVASALAARPAGAAAKLRVLRPAGLDAGAALAAIRGLALDTRRRPAGRCSQRVSTCIRPVLLIRLQQRQQHVYSLHLSTGR